jgi:hypothetical protein
MMIQDKTGNIVYSSTSIYGPPSEGVDEMMQKMTGERWSEILGDIERNQQYAEENVMNDAERAYYKDKGRDEELDFGKMGRKLGFDTDEMEEELIELIKETHQRRPTLTPQNIVNMIYDEYREGEPMIKYIDTFIGNDFDLRQYVEVIMTGGDE